MTFFFKHLSNQGDLVHQKILFIKDYFFEVGQARAQFGFKQPCMNVTSYLCAMISRELPISTPF